MSCVVIGRWDVLTCLTELPSYALGYSLLSRAHSDTYIVLHKSLCSVKMPVKVHAARVHFMLECPAL